MRIFLAFAVLFIYAALCYICWWRYRRSQTKSETSFVAAGETWMIAYASQGGTAAQLAWQSADQLSQAGIATQVISLNRLDDAALQQRKKILFVVSTFGEGEPPDNGNRILVRLAGAALPQLSYGLLALGDRNYRFFCGFGHALDHALHAAGATPLFDLIEVDRGDPAALRHWQYYLGQISGQSHFRDWQTPDYDRWMLLTRNCLNNGSPGAPAYWLQLAADAAGNTWCAGDIVEIGPCNSRERVESFLQAVGRSPVSHKKLLHELRRRELPASPHAAEELISVADDELLRKLPALPHREYSIASIPEIGTLDLLVRQVITANGELGLGSGWLTRHTEIGEAIALRIRSNPSFHPPKVDVPMILIGNGTGMAGLRAHLLARERAGGTRNWLLFGERTARYDFFFGEQIHKWHKNGAIEFVDLVFSRDAAPGVPRYVQDLLPLHSERLHAWIDGGAAIYVCGSLQGMAHGVDLALAQILGREQLDAMAECRRYCRDVY